MIRKRKTLEDGREPAWADLNINQMMSTHWASRAGEALQAVGAHHSCWARVSAGGNDSAARTRVMIGEMQSRVRTLALAAYSHCDERDVTGSRE